MSTCEACLSTDVRFRARRRRAGAKIIQCRTCGLRGLRVEFDLDTLADAYDAPADYVSEWTDDKRESVSARAWPATVDRISELLGARRDGRNIFDVGAADGSFLSLARRAGYDPHGNELSSGAIELARSRYGIELFKGDLSLVPGAGAYDAVTMWCVLAHVPDADQLLRDAHRLLRPGGVLFMQTPRWTSMDSTALLALELSRGRVSRIVDRRTPGHHLRFHTTRSITAQLERLGFEVLDVQARARYSLNTSSYLSSIGVGPRLARVLNQPLNWMLSRELFYRIVVDVYARKIENGKQTGP